MDFWKRLNNRGRILLLLLASLVMLNVIVLVTTYNLRSFSGSISSMLNDRLVPSTDIAHIQEFSYKNRLFLEDLIYRKKRRNLEEQISINNQLLDSTFVKYKKTHFTEEEAEHAIRFWEALKQYREHEKNIISLLRQGKQEEAEALFTEESYQAFQSLIQELHLLSGIQVVVGRLLYENADNNIKSIKMVTYISLAISLVVAIQLLKVLGVKPL